MLVSDGYTSDAIGRSSKPTTETSRGMENLHSRAARIIRSANKS